MNIVSIRDLHTNEFKSPECEVKFVDKFENYYKLELKFLNSPLNNNGFNYSWCNGWYHLEPLIKTKPDFKIFEKDKDSFIFLKEVTHQLNKKYFPKIEFPNLELPNKQNIEFLNQLLIQFKNYVKEINWDIEENKKNQKLLQDSSICLLLSILGLYNITDDFIILSREDYKLNNNFKYEYKLKNEKYVFINTINFISEIFNLKINFTYYSNENFNVGDSKNLSFKFDYYYYKNSYIFDYKSHDLIKSIHKNNSNCFIVTTTMEDINHPVVVDFRRYRDEVLLNTYFGRVFINIYYRIGPVLSKVIKTNSFLFTISKKLVLRLHKRLR
jgi:hypothetical protein